MKKIFTLLLLSLGVFANEIDYKDNISLDLRSVYINYDYDRGFDDAEVFVTSAKLKYEQNFLDSLTAGIAFATVQDLGILNNDLSKRNMAYIIGMSPIN